MLFAFTASHFDAPHNNACENRRKALLNMKDKINIAIDIEDYQAAIDQLRNIHEKKDWVTPTSSTNDRILGLMRNPPIKLFITRFKYYCWYVFHAHKGKNRENIFMKYFVFTVVVLGFFASGAWAETAVTVNLTSGPAFTEQGLTTIEMIVPDRPEQSALLNVGDKIFFVISPSLEGEGIIANIYDTQDMEANRAIMLDHAVQ